MRNVDGHGVAPTSRPIKIIGLFCRKPSFLKVSFAKDTYKLKEPNNCSQPIDDTDHCVSHVQLSDLYRLWITVFRTCVS